MNAPTGRQLRAAVRATPLDLACPPGPVVDVLAGEADPAILESSALHPAYGRYTLLTCRPLRVLTLHEGVLRDGAGHALSRCGDDDSLWAALEAELGSVHPVPAAEPPAYLPGWIGYVGYEVGRHVERLPGRAGRDAHLPDLRLALYDAILLYDALEARWTLVELVFEQSVEGAGQAAQALRAVARSAPEAGQAHAPPLPADRADAARRDSARTRADFQPAQYERAVARCVGYIASGDIFQVNLSQRLVVEQAPEPMAIYRSLRRRNPAWYAAYLAFEQAGRRAAVISSSPELFLRVRGRHVTTRPIKGTRRRTGEAGADQRARLDLLASPKDNAELAMIIDLLRNDLGRVCRFGSVVVTEACRLETHPTVFHLVGTVEGELRQGVGPAELLRATFPGGSITGAPKIRAMEIIDELEPHARGVYTGCIGMVGVDGSCEWNIAIRTIVHDRGRALVQVGGGILADSDPRCEYNETLDKARAMLEAIHQARVEEGTA